MARGARADLGAPPPAHARPGAHAGQPAGRAGAARLLEVPDRRGRRQAAHRPAGADRACGRRGNARPGGDIVRAVADPRRRRAARHHRHAQARPGAGDAPAGALLRLDADRRARVAHHERRGRHPEPGRHRAGAAGRRPGDRGDGPGRPVLAQLAPDDHHHPGARRVRRRHGLRLPHAAAAVPRARQDQRRGHRPSHRVARRHPRRQVLHGGEARRDRLHQGRAPAVPQRRQVDDRRLGHHRRQHRRHRHRRRADDLARRPRDPRRRDDARRPRHVHLLHRPGRRAAGLDRLDRHADHRGVRRSRPHPRSDRHADRDRRGRQPQRRCRRSPATSRSRTSGSSTSRGSRCCAACRSSRRPGRRRRWSVRAARARAR